MFSKIFSFLFRNPNTTTGVIFASGGILLTTSILMPLALAGSIFSLDAKISSMPLLPFLPAILLVLVIYFMYVRAFYFANLVMRSSPQAPKWFAWMVAIVGGADLSGATPAILGVCSWMLKKKAVIAYAVILFFIPFLLLWYGAHYELTAVEATAFSLAYQVVFVIAVLKLKNEEEKFNLSFALLPYVIFFMSCGIFLWHEKVLSDELASFGNEVKTVKAKEKSPELVQALKIAEARKIERILSIPFYLENGGTADKDCVNTAFNVLYAGAPAGKCLVMHSHGLSALLKKPMYKCFILKDKLFSDKYLNSLENECGSVDDFKRLSDTIPVAGVFSKIFLPVYDKSVPTDDADNLLAVAETALAVEDFRIKTKQLPNDLKELVPAFAKSVPDGIKYEKGEIKKYAPDNTITTFNGYRVFYDKDGTIKDSLSAKIAVSVRLPAVRTAPAAAVVKE